MRRSVETARIVPELAIRDIHVPNSLGIRELTESPDDQSVSRVELVLACFQIVKELLPCGNYRHLVIQRRVIWVNQIELNL